MYYLSHRRWQILNWQLVLYHDVQLQMEIYFNLLWFGSHRCICTSMNRSWNLTLRTICLQGSMLNTPYFEDLSRGSWNMESSRIESHFSWRHRSIEGLHMVCLGQLHYCTLIQWYRLTSESQKCSYQKQCKFDLQVNTAKCSCPPFHRENLCLASQPNVILYRVTLLYWSSDWSTVLVLEQHSLLRCQSSGGQLWGRIPIVRIPT